MVDDDDDGAGGSNRNYIGAYAFPKRRAYYCLLQTKKCTAAVSMCKKNSRTPKTKADASLAFWACGRAALFVDAPSVFVVAPRFFVVVPRFRPKTSYDTVHTA